MTSDERSEMGKRLGVRDEDVDVLLAAYARPNSRRRPFGLVIALVLSGGLAIASVRSELAAFLSRVNPPEPGELIPRQIPYRGYLERDGVPVATAQTFAFRLEYGDGGVAWTDPSVSLPVSGGHFEVALGDNPSNKIPTSVFADPFVLLSVSVGGTPLVGKQRLLTVPFASRAERAWSAGNSDSSATSALYRGADITNSLVPAGAVIAFSGVTPPPGWLLCDGASVSRAQYPGLYAAIGDSHGAPDAQTFNLPDYRGRFLRGLDLGSLRDFDRDSRLPMAAGGNSGDQVGTVQGDQLRAHTHVLVKSDAAGGGQRVAFGGSNNNAESTPVQQTGGSETRPQNAAVVWIVKY